MTFPPMKPEIETPSSLTAFFIGNKVFNSSADTPSNSLRLLTAPATVRLRVISSKSANFTLRVTVRPHVPFVFAMSPDLVDQRLQFGQHRLKLGEVAEEGVFSADGFPNPVGADSRLRRRPARPVVIAFGFPEVCPHEFERLDFSYRGSSSRRVRSIHLGAGGTARYQ